MNRLIVADFDDRAAIAGEAQELEADSIVPERWRAAASTWLSELEAAGRLPATIDDALDAASSALRRAARREEISVFARVNVPKTLAWVEGRGTAGECIGRVPPERFDGPLVITPGGIIAASMGTRLFLGEPDGAPLADVVFDGSEILERWPDPDPQHVWTTTDAPAAPLQIATAAPEDEAFSTGPDDLALAARVWMRGFVKGRNANGIKPKRDPTLQECMAENHCTYRQALAAWEGLPPEWKNPPRKPNGS